MGTPLTPGVSYFIHKIFVGLFLDFYISIVTFPL